MSKEKKDQLSNPEVWGGIECTVVRINDGYRDQLQLAGHYSRPSDIDSLAALGIKALRYPVLWEVHQPDPSVPIDWSRTEAHLSAIRQHAFTPIIGLLHHGSGPSFTSLKDPGFPGYFANYAAAVAAKYPWVEYFTPINEPLTTARFSGLYGFWYPHCKDDHSFARMLIHQVTGIVRAMEAIRRINPAAKLLQTEDLAKVHSTPLLAYQADFENHRRWLTWDLLCGKVDRTHPLYGYLVSAGILEEELSFLRDTPCVPDLLGVNYYITSERYLDDQLEKYPAAVHGGNGKHSYADVAAVHVGRRAGLSVLLAETNERYHLPIVISEVHMHCTREEQVRWLYEIWVIACRARRTGIDVRAISSWALMGAYDWDSLLTREDDKYECGAYAVEGGELRLTAIGYLLRALATDAWPGHPVLDMPGWWNNAPVIDPGSQRLLVTGRNGAVARIITDLCCQRGIPFTFIASEEEPGAWPRHPDDFWGAVEIAERPVTAMGGWCEKTGLPYLCIGPQMEQDEGDIVDIQELLDLFIDRTFEMACVLQLI